ncbi:MAG: hypothetical protein AAB885_02525, partial [Patescibacteria group bacterium]
IFNRIDKAIMAKSEVVTTESVELKTVASEPSFSKNYAVWVKNGVESDLSIAPDNPDKLLIITLEERLILELKYFSETGNHLDIARYTHCLNSRDPWQNYIVVTWYPVQLNFAVKQGGAFGWFNGEVPTREVIR